MQDLAAVKVAVVKNLAYTYSSNSVVLDNISFAVNEGDLLGIVGPNGAGKTTLFSCMLGLFEDYRGEITIFDQDIRKNKKVHIKAITKWKISPNSDIVKPPA